MAGDVVIVTGASRGIGFEVCRRFVAAGAAVGMIAREGDALAAAAERLAGRDGGDNNTGGGRAFAAAADVADPEATVAAVAAIEDALGPPTVLVSNAGIGAWGAVVDTPASEFRRLVEVNYLGAVHATAAVLAGMVGRGRGRIVNVGSIAGRIGAPFEAAYSASKFALVGYSEALAIELSGTGVTVVLVEPGPVDTEFFARRGHPYDLARPRPQPADTVADAIVRAAAGGGERFVPRWLRVAHVVKTAVPGAYRRATEAMYAEARNELAGRLGADRGSTSGGPKEHP